MISSKLQLHTLFPDLATRQSGAILRKRILEILNTHPCVQLDFDNVIMTPSFADEAFGLLCLEMTQQALKEKVQFTNITPSQKALLIRVLGNRFTTNNKS